MRSSLEIWLFSEALGFFPDEAIRLFIHSHGFTTNQKRYVEALGYILNTKFPEAGEPNLGPESDDKNSGTFSSNEATDGTHIPIASLLALTASICGFMWYPETRNHSVLP